jgi:mono/diheme cytochrome c family protein
VLAKKTVLLSFSLMLGGLPVLYAQDAAMAGGSGLFTAEQAHRGETLYQKQCVACHGAALDGAGPYPPLSGDEFIGKYQGQPITNLYDMIQKLMPATQPGTLTRPQAADLLSYILSFNKFPAGKTELPSDDDSLKKIKLPKPAPKA